MAVTGVPITPTNYTSKEEAEKDGNTYTDANFTEAVAMSDAWIDKICVDHFLPLTQTHLMDGTKENILSFLPYTLLKCISIASVVDLDDDPDTSLTEVVHPPGKVSGAYEFYRYEHFLKRAEPTEVWPSGCKNIKVIGSFGWSAVPGAIQNVSTLLTRMILDPESELDMTALSVRIGDLSYTRPQVSEHLREMTGVPAADRILHAYLNPALMSPMII